MNTRRSKLFLILIGLLLLAVATACSTRSKPEISLVADSLLASEAEQMLWLKSELEQRTFDSNDLIIIKIFRYRRSYCFYLGKINAAIFVFRRSDRYND